MTPHCNKALLLIKNVWHFTLLIPRIFLQLEYETKNTLNKIQCKQV